MSRATAKDGLDALALVQALRRGDESAIERVLASSDVRAVARALATVLPRAVRTQATSVDDFLRGLGDRALDKVDLETLTVPPSVTSAVDPAVQSSVASAVAEHVRALLDAIDAGRIEATDVQRAYLQGAVDTLKPPVHNTDV
ncbi:MAG TPA: hypothetical protein VHY21_08240 [Pseudonocardiaceae bacterium]|nr:hypothetical protein [Pseudonocardiaceae bacterium]